MYIHVHRSDTHTHACTHAPHTAPYEKVSEAIARFLSCLLGQTDGGAEEAAAVNGHHSKKKTKKKKNPKGLSPSGIYMDQLHSLSPHLI